MRILYFLYTWLVFIPLVVLDTVFFGAVCLLMAPFFSPRRVGFATAVPWARVGLATSWVTVHIHGREHINPKQSYVVVANHLSLFDIWVLYGWLNMDLRWVAKKEVRYIPIIGISCVALGHIFVDRSNHSKAMASLQQARDRIINGTSILFFPEGTRSRTGELKPFKKGAFHMAQDLDLPVLPVTIIGTREILPSDTARLTPAREVTLVIHPPIRSDDIDVDTLIERSHSAIRSGLEPVAMAS
jgi:1-acyl-sn-glycerol-3-phosphate acyltransferase